MKKIFVVLISILIILTSCVSSPAKMIVYTKSSNNGKVNLVSIKIGATPSVSTIIEDYPMWWDFADPGGRSIILYDDGGQNGTAVLRIIDRKGNIRDLAVPPEITPGSFKVSFDQSGTAYVEVYYYNHETKAACFKIYKIQGDKFIKTAEANFDGSVTFVYYNGGLAYRNKIVVVPINLEEKWVKLYDMATGTTVTISPRLGEYPDVPVWSPDARKYVYGSLYDEHNVCWIYNDGRSDQKLICLPSDWPNGKGAAAPTWADVAWSPNGRYIAVEIPEANMVNESLYIFDISGKPRLVSSVVIPGYVGSLVWSPDSALLGFSTWDQKQAGVYTLDLHNSLTEVYNLPGFVYPTGGLGSPVYLSGWLK
jgi:hypothetical protein